MLLQVATKDDLKDLKEKLDLLLQQQKDTGTTKKAINQHVAISLL